MPPRAKSKPSEPDDADSGANGSSAASGGLRLVIVESPAKARTIAGYLGDGYLVESSIGHIRDLPRNAADVPAAVKSQALVAPRRRRRQRLRAALHRHG